MYALLVAEDPDDSAIFSMVLQRAGLAVTTAKTLENGLENWQERSTDIILLAASSALAQQQVHAVRVITQVPLIVAVDSVSEQLHVELLKQGADLIVTSPFSIKVLAAQVSVLLRRTGGVPAFSLPDLNIDNLTLNPATRTLEVAGKSPQRLTHLEFRLLYTLMTHQGQVIPTDTIVERVWGYTDQGDRDLVRGLVSRLRIKVENDPRNPQYILTMQGVGYVFNGEDG